MIGKKQKKIYYIILISTALLTLLFISYRNTLSYLAIQAIGQARIILYSVKIEDYLVNNNLPEDKKQKLQIITEIKDYGVKEIGLKESKNYTAIYDQKGKPLLWLVQACPSFSLEPYMWKFPFVGNVSYKGFFKKSDALKESQKLKKLGYDVYIRNPSAWSTLGFFKDPIFSEMLNWSEGDLANVVFHEMTHSTIFIKDNLQFNENIATFIGNNASVKYMESKYGKNSTELKNYLRSSEDENLFYDHILKGSELLSELYSSFEPELTHEQKTQKKTELIKSIMNSLDSVPFSDREAYFAYKNYIPNNAWFSGFRTYRNDFSEIEKEFKEKFNSDFKAYIKYLKNEK